MFLVDVAVGGAIIALPQGRLPLMALTAAFQGYKAASQRKAARRADSSEGKRQDGAEKAARPGQGDVPPATLTFEDISSVISSKKGTKQILDSVSGAAKPGRLLALMGPSGSGKTSLLNALAQRTPVTALLTLSGRLRVNGREPGAAGAPRSGYVQQEDLFYSQMTVQETLDMVATLRLPKGTSAEARRQAVDDVVGMLDLTGVRGTVVGDAKTRGVSGGERKRLSIACELLSAPSLIFLDEPTTGLDAFQALKVMQALKQLAEAGHTIVVAIHQPRSTIFDLFDDLLLLAQGRLVYGGTAEGALAHFEGLGHECPQHHNPAEFLADLISIDQSSEGAIEESQGRLNGLVEKRAEQDVDEASGDAEASGTTGAHTAPQSPELGVQVRTLFKRSWRQVTRDKGAIKLRVLTNVQSALVFGTIWWRLRRIQKAVPSRFGMLQVVAVYTAQTALFKTLNLFPPEKQLVQMERANGSYGVLPYFASKILAELPTLALYPLVHSAIVYPMTGLQPGLGKFARYAGSNIIEALSATALGMAVGAAAPSTEAALVLGPAVVLVFIVFGGLYTNLDDMPAYLKWLPNTSNIKTGFDALVKNEFKGLELEKDHVLQGYAEGEQVLEARGFDRDVGSSIMQQGRIALFFWWLTYCILRAKQPEFQPMVPPEEAPNAPVHGNGSG